MKKKRLMLLLMVIFTMLVYGCNNDDDSKKTSQDPKEPAFKTSNFSNPTTINNTYLPMIPGTAHTYQAETEDGVETIVTEVLEDTRKVNGVECVVFRDRVFLDELLIEDTNDWFAQDDSGNVWYMGEDVPNYEYNDDAFL